MGGARPLRPGRARAGRPAGRRRGRDGVLDAIAGARSRGSRRSARNRRGRAAGAGPGPGHRGGRRARQRHRPRAPRAPHRGRRRCSPSAVTTAGCVFVGGAARPPSATTPPAPTTCCPPAAPAASRGRSGRAPSGAGSRPSRFPQDAARELAPTVATLARAEGFPVHGESRRERGAEAIEAAWPHRRDQPRDHGDPGQALARPRRRRGEGRDRRRLPRPHARPARPPRAARPRGRGERRPRDRRPPHGRGRRHRASGRRSTRRWATAPGSAATARPWCRWTRRWPSARSTSRAARSAPSTPTCRDVDRRLRHRAGRGVLPRRRQQRQADPARLGPLRHQRPPHDRGLLQGLRPRPARGRLDRPRGERRALDQGDADANDQPGSRILDYGMGNLRSVEKALEHVGAEAAITADARGCAPPTA